MSSIENIDFGPELHFQTSRSGGKGGQHVNKVETKVELSFNVNKSALLTDEQKKWIQEKLQNRINILGELKISVEEERSQTRNKEIAIGRFYELLKRALKKPKRRIPTKLPKSIKEKRLENKRKQAEKKKFRQNPEF